MAITRGAGTQPSLRPRSSIAWPIAMGLLAVLVFVFYKFFLPNLTDSIAVGVNRWLPLSVLNLCMIWVIMALGLNIVVGYAGLLDLGYVAFWAIGAYTGASLMSTFRSEFNIHFFSPTIYDKAAGIHLNFAVVLIIAAIVCGIFGIIIGAPTLRLRSDYLALVTLGFGEIIPQVFLNGENINGFNLSNGSKGINPVDNIGTGAFDRIQGINPVLGPFDYSYKFVIYAGLAALCIFISLRIRGGRLGRAWLALREDELAANMMGVPLIKTKLSAYAVGALFGGLGGAAYATQVNGAFADDFSFAKSITILLMVVLGGMGNVWGVTVGALVLAWINQTGLKEFGNTFNGRFGTEINFPSYNYLIFGVILVLMMLFRPEGLIPERRTKQIMHEPSRTEMESMGADIEAAEAQIEVTEAEPLPGETASAPVGPPSGGKRLNP